jgi:hypothetical protein
MTAPEIGVTTPSKGYVIQVVTDEEATWEDRYYWWWDRD